MAAKRKRLEKAIEDKKEELEVTSAIHQAKQKLKLANMMYPDGIGKKPPSWFPSPSSTSASGSSASAEPACIGQKPASSDGAPSDDVASINYF